MNAVTCKCDVCKAEFTAKVADRKRGWARCCSKRCAAIKRERRTGTYRSNVARIEAAKRREEPDDDYNAGHIFASGYFGHGQE